MSDPLLATKFYIPPLLPGQVKRPRLVVRLDESLTRKLALVSAPAGYGKTTLASEWVSQLQHARVGWLSLDKEDNDPARFIRYLIAVIQKVEPGAGESALAMVGSPRLGSPQTLPLEALLNTLVNDLVLIPDPIILVLEDYHAIHAEPIHQSITYLLDHTPPNVHFAITSRAEPPLPIPRWRGRGQLVELRAKDLRFTDDEADELFNRSMQLGLDPGKVAVLIERTEGWIAGLQMAALSIQGIQQVRGEEGVSAFIRSFAGSQRFVLDYLIEEVLSQQPPEVQEFLLKTSLLDRLSAPLCDHLSGRNDSQELLTLLERNNLLLIPLDDRRRWYRYHHLFSDLLQLRLEQDFKEQIPQLYRQVSVWYAQAGYVTDALHHALATGDHYRVAELVAGNTLALFYSGELPAISKWLQSVSADGGRLTSGCLLPAPG